MLHAFQILLFDRDDAKILPVLSGPMLGHVSDSAAKVWVRIAPGASLQAEGKFGESIVQPTNILDLDDGIKLIEFSNLHSDVKFEIQLRVKALGSTQIVNTVGCTAPKPSNNGKLKFAFGSCSHITKHPFSPIYEAIAFEQPSFMIFLGDNGYFFVSDDDWATSGPIGDWSSPEKMLRRHLELRDSPYGRRLYKSVPTYAIWDDHDYGTNNADSSFEGREFALQVFKQMWANPSYGTENTPGIFSSFRHGPAEFFLMDNRYYKYGHNEMHPDVPLEEGIIWGDAQLQWLMNGLKKSTAPVKFIVNGTQILSKRRPHKDEGHLQEAPAERKRLFDYIKENEIGGVVILSGDTHYTESLQHKVEGSATIIEFTSSPLQDNKQVSLLNRDDVANVWAMRGNSYGLITLNIPENGEGKIIFEARNDGNQPIRIGEQDMKTIVPLKDINY